MIEVQDILRLYGESYRVKFAGNTSTGQYKVMHHLEMCRTAALGGHLDHCDECDHERISYNSCRDRHCPKCQFLKKEKWLENRLSDFLPINYFHVVFTIPSELNTLMLNNQKILYDLFFSCVSETLKEISSDKKFLGANIGFIIVLHTWGQNLLYHPHIHCIVTGGGLSDSKDKWISSKNKFLFPIKVLGSLFCGKFLSYLEKEYFNKSLKTNLSKKDFKKLLDLLYQKNWVVYSKPPFKRPETVFEYLARYTHRIAISNHRIIAIKDDHVLFKWRDYADNNKEKVMSLHAHEFIRRFLLHVLPKGFVKIRHYGLFCNRNRKQLLTTVRTILKVTHESHIKNVESWKELYLRITGNDIDFCPVCKNGTMIIVKELEPVYCRGP
jgi:hypothetical protein